MFQHEHFYYRLIFLPKHWNFVPNICCKYAPFRFNQSVTHRCIYLSLRSQNSHNLCPALSLCVFMTGMQKASAVMHVTWFYPFTQCINESMHTSLANFGGIFVQCTKISLQIKLKYIVRVCREMGSFVGIESSSVYAWAQRIGEFARIENGITCENQKWIDVAGHYRTTGRCVWWTPIINYGKIFCITEFLFCVDG